MKYLDALEARIWKNTIVDDAVYQCLQCEIVRINTILLETSQCYNEHPLHGDKLEETYEYEQAYKERVIELLTRIENSRTNKNK